MDATVSVAWQPVEPRSWHIRSIYLDLELSKA